MTNLAATPLRITGTTRVMFIMGDPIRHVVGTAVLNAAWGRLGRDLVTVPLHVTPERLADTLGMLRATPNVAGTGITIPHKIEALGLMDHLTEAARNVGAVNFVRRNTDGSLTGHNVDGAGFVAGLAEAGHDVRGRTVVLAGAGGVARAIAFAVAGAGAARLVIVNRSMDRAEALAQAVGDWPGAAGCTVVAGGPIEAADLYINGTSLGMRDGDPLPFDLACLVPGAVVAEVVMTPAVTPLLAAAADRGCRVVPGRAMLDPQADLVAAFLDGQPA